MKGNGRINGQICSFNGELSPGNSEGIMEFTNKLTLEDSNMLNIEIGGKNGGGQLNGNDSIRVAGQASLSGILKVSLISDFSPQLGDRFEIISSNGVIDSFENVLIPDILPYTWQVEYLPEGVAVEVIRACTQVLNLDSQPIPSGIYQASQLIEASGLINMSSDVIFRTEREVVFLPPLEVHLGGKLEVINGECLE